MIVALRQTLVSASVAACALVAPGLAAAQPSSITISDGSAHLVLNAINGFRTGPNGGIGDLRTGLGAEPVDHLWQNWFWYRTTGDTREYALSNLLAVSGASGNRARLVYSEPANDGATPNALLVELQYTISDLTAGAVSPERVLLTIAFKLENRTGGNLNVQFFNYNDMDLRGSVFDDSCRVSGSSNHIQTITAFENAVYQETTATYVASATNHVRYQVSEVPQLLLQLWNNEVNDLTNSAPVFGPADYSGANQWGVTLGPAGGVQSTLVGSVTIMIETSVCRGDFDRDGQVNSGDVTSFLTAWLSAVAGGCP